MKPLLALPVRAEGINGLVVILHILSKFAFLHYVAHEIGKTFIAQLSIREVVFTV